MSEGPAEKKDGFERWVASLKLEARTLNVPGARPEADHHDSSEPPPSGPLSLDEQVTLVQRLPKDIVKALRERESNRAARDSSRPLGKVDEESTAVFVPPPELLARAKRFAPPPKPSRPAPEAPSSDPPADQLGSDAPEAAPRHNSEFPTMPPPADVFEEPPEPASAPRPEARESFPGQGRAAAQPNHGVEHRNPSVPIPDRRSAPAANYLRTPTFAFEAVRPTPAGGFPAVSKPTPAGGFPAVTPPGSMPAANPRSGRPSVTRASAPGVPSSVPRGFSNALFPARVEPAPVPSTALDTSDEEPTSIARLSPPEVAAPGVLPSPIVNINADSERPLGPPKIIESVAPPTAEVDGGWEEDEAETRAAPKSTRESAPPPSAAPESAGESLEALGESAASSGPSYLLLLGWTAAALLIAGAVWLTFFR